MRQKGPGRAELDSHCDTCSFGHDAVLVYDTGQRVAVNGFIGSLGSVSQVPVGTVAVAYDCPTSLQTYVLFFHQAMYFKDMTRHLLCPAQMRHNQVVVNEVPLLHLAPEDRHAAAHSIVFQEPPLHIPLKLSGTVSYFPTRRPTQAELDSDRDCIYVNVTSEAYWDPLDRSNTDAEDALRASLTSKARLGGQRLIGACESHRSISVVSSERVSAAFDIDSYASALEERSVSVLTSKNRKS